MWLTIAEKLFVLRRRAGETQLGQARLLGVPVERYLDWERGHRPCDFDVADLVLSLPEKCLLVRRRAGFTQRELAARVGCSRRWVNLMEQGQADCVRLAKFWDNNGFLGCGT